MGGATEESMGKLIREAQAAPAAGAEPAVMAAAGEPVVAPKVSVPTAEQKPTRADAAAVRA